MAVISESVKAMNGYKLHVVKTEKYKTNTLVWKMKAPLEKSTVTLRSLLPHVLQSSSSSYPSTGKLRAYLDELYGATLFVDLAKKGEYHVITISVEIANEKFLSDPTPLLKKAFQFLAEILTKPNVHEGAFDEGTVEKEKGRLNSEFNQFTMIKCAIPISGLFRKCAKMSRMHCMCMARKMMWTISLLKDFMNIISRHWHRMSLIYML